MVASDVDDRASRSRHQDSVNPRHFVVCQLRLPVPHSAGEIRVLAVPVHNKARPQVRVMDSETVHERSSHSGRDWLGPHSGQEGPQAQHVALLLRSLIEHLAQDISTAPQPVPVLTVHEVLDLGGGVARCECLGTCESAALIGGDAGKWGI
jgi:hypothetical protein